MPRGPQPYEPAWLVALARTQHPDQPALAAALAACTTRLVCNPQRVLFHRPTKANPVVPPGPGHDSVWLHDPVRGALRVVWLADGRISGIEFTRRVSRYA